MYVLNLKASFLPVKKRLSVQNCSTALDWTIQCVFWQLGPSPPCIHLMSFNASRPSHFNFSPVSHSHVLLRTQIEGKRGEAWKRGYMRLLVESIFSQIHRSGMYHSRPMYLTTILSFLSPLVCADSGRWTCRYR